MLEGAPIDSVIRSADVLHEVSEKNMKEKYEGNQLSIIMFPERLAPNRIGEL